MKLIEMMTGILVGDGHFGFVRDGHFGQRSVILAGNRNFRLFLIGLNECSQNAESFGKISHFRLGAHTHCEIEKYNLKNVFCDKLSHKSNAFHF